MSRSKDIGNAGERHHRRLLRLVWPDIDKGPDRHPTDDHSNTGVWHVQSKKRSTWNIKDVVLHMEKHVSERDPWVVLYEDRDRRKKGNPSRVYAILPAEEFASLVWWSGQGDQNPYDGTDDGAERTEPAEQLTPTDLLVELVVQLCDSGAVEPDLLQEILATRFH